MRIIIRKFDMENESNNYFFEGGKILVACEESQTITIALRKAGFEAYSCDILEQSGGHPEWHIKGDAIKEAYSGKYSAMIAHPPCTYLSNAGVQYLHKQPERWKKMIKAKEFFMKLLNAPIPQITVENPVPHKYAKLPAYTQIVYPYWFGDSFSKRTCLWLKGFHKLVATNIVDKGEFYKCGNGGTNPKWYSTSAKNRSKTFQGIADAIVSQWFCKNQKSDGKK